MKASESLFISRVSFTTRERRNHELQLSQGSGKSGRGTVEARKRRRWRMRPTVVVLEDRRLLSTFTVNNNASSGASARCPTRSAWRIQPGGRTRSCSSSFFNTPQTITLGGTQLELSTANESVTITGPAAGVTVSGGGASRVFQVDAGVTASISGLTITGGNDHRQGGGLDNFGTTTLTNCTVSGNSAYDGGGLYQRRHAHADQLHRQRQLRHATPRTSPTGAGGLYNGGTLTLTNCTVSGNTASGVFTGGGVVNGTRYNTAPTLTMINCTVSANTGWRAAADGDLGATVTLTNTIVAEQRRRRRRLWLSFVGHEQLDRHRLLQTGLSERGQRQPRQRDQPAAGPAGQLRRADPDHGPAARQPGDQRRHQRPGIPDDRPARPGPGRRRRHRRLREPGLYRHASSVGSTPQTASIGTAFANPLAVSVTANNPVEPVNGGVVTFVANPASNGASAVLLDPLGRHRQRPGRRHRRAQQHGSAVSTVTASASVGLPATFNLTNTGPVFAQLDREYDKRFSLPGSGPVEPALRPSLFADIDPSGNSSITFEPYGLRHAADDHPDWHPARAEQHRTRSETITGPAAGVTVNGGGLSRVFQVDAGVTASISGLTISGGNARSATGGGLANFGTTTLTNCTVSGNSARLRLVVASTMPARLR